MRSDYRSGNRWHLYFDSCKFVNKNIRVFFRSSDPKCPEDGEEISKQKVSAFHRNLCGKFCVTVS